VRLKEICTGQAMYAARIGAAISAFGRSKTPKGAQREGHHLRRHANGRAAFGGSEDDCRGQQPGGREQHVAPDDPDKEEGRRHQREQWQQER
jgi:hypothetical protein